MDDLPFYILFNSVSIISGQLEIDNERLCAMNSIYFPPTAGLESLTAKTGKPALSVLSYWAPMIRPET